MGCLITVNHLYKIFKWTSIFFAIITLVLVITRVSVDPLRCSRTMFTKLTIDQVREQCLEEHKPIEEHLFWKSYPRLQMKDNLLIYENNYNHLHYVLLILTIVSFFGLKGYWHLRYKFKVRDFILISTENDQSLIEGFKKNLKIAKKLNFRYYLTFTLIGFVEIGTFLLLLGLFTLKDGRFISLGFEWLGEGFDTDNFSHLFPRRVNCRVEAVDHLSNFPSMMDMLFCELKLNTFYESIFIILWFYFLVLLILMIICLVQLIILSNSESYRLERVRKLLPTVEEQSLVRLSSDVNSYFILEALYAKLDGDKFQKLIKLLVDENYYLDKIAEDVADV